MLTFVLKCGCDRSVRILYIFLPKRKKKKKGKSKIQLRIKKTNMVFLVLFLLGAGISVKKEYNNYQHLPTDLLASDGISGIWCMRERIVAFLGCLLTSNERRQCFL